MVGCRSVQVGLARWACSPSRSCSGPWVVRQSMGVVSVGLPPWRREALQPQPSWVVPVALLLVAAVLIGVTYHLDQAVHGGSGRFRCECKSKARTEHGRLLSSLAAGHSSPCSGSRSPSRATPLLAGRVVLAHGAAGNRCGGKLRAGTCPRRPLRRGTAAGRTWRGRALGRHRPAGQWLVRPGSGRCCSGTRRSASPCRLAGGPFRAEIGPAAVG